MPRYRDRGTVVRAPLVSGAYNAQTRDWANATRTPSGCSLQPLSSAEDVVLQQRTVTRWRLFLPPTTDLQATDRFEHGTPAISYEVDGDVEEHYQRGLVHHREAVLVRTQGG